MAYVDATAADLKAAFPRFADVEDATVEFWLVRARRSVDQSWTEGDYTFAQELLAAHYMTLEGLGAGTEAELNAQGLGDFTSVKSGSFSFTRKGGSDSVKAGSLGSTTYGQRWAALAKANKGGPRVSPSGEVPAYPPFPDPYISSGGV